MIKQTFFLILFLFITQLGFANGTHYQKSDFFATMQPGDKAALLMVHFGTTHDDTRELTINAINQKAQAMFPNLDMREAYTSRIIIHRLKQRGMEKLTPLEMLKQLHKDGYTHVIIQSSNIIDGIEMESLRQDVHEVEKDFKEIRIGKPLLYGKEDYEQVIDALIPSLPTEGAIVLVGHGTYTPIMAAYTMVDYMLKAKGYTHAHVGTIEGYPAFADVEGRTRKDRDIGTLYVCSRRACQERHSRRLEERFGSRRIYSNKKISDKQKGMAQIIRELAVSFTNVLHFLAQK